jgi:hypothetical protein
MRIVRVCGYFLPILYMQILGDKPLSSDATQTPQLLQHYFISKLAINHYICATVNNEYVHFADCNGMSNIMQESSFQFPQHA